ncbi:MAG: hypothetical protein O7G85_03590 [Planctomycetota bacterium]|nr:hypothetical protein [Planctomycetota bacterium]
MQQIRIFKSIESEVGELERDINGWLQESGVKVVNIFGNIAPQTVLTETTAGSGRSFSPSDVFLVVVYESG